ncbi:MAG: RNA polymerase sigma-I factor [Hyphomonadaceae bacterium]|nr:RNA polymerase sigma-I factor [Clostridia bacterium]
MQAVNDEILHIRQDSNELEAFIQAYKPFITKCVKRYTGKYVNWENDDECSIAMIAFHDAIKSYEPDKGEFLAYAGLIIRSRLVDFSRREKKHQQNISSIITSVDDVDEMVDLTQDQSQKVYNEQQLSEFRKLELLEFSKSLLQYNISIIELPEHSPKQDKLRTECFRMIDYIVHHELLVHDIQRKKTLPLVELEKQFKIPRKKLERLRKYLVALFIIYSGDYQFIKQFIKEV